MNKQDKIDGNNNKSNTYLDMHKHSNLKLCLSVLEIGLLGRIVGEDREGFKANTNFH